MEAGDGQVKKTTRLKEANAKVKDKTVAFS